MMIQVSIHIVLFSLQIGLYIAGILAVILSVRPWVVLPTAVLGVVFVWLRSFYMHTSRDIKRLEGISRSPVFSLLSTSLQGKQYFNFLNITFRRQVSPLSEPSMRSLF